MSISLVEWAIGNNLCPSLYIYLMFRGDPKMVWDGDSGGGGYDGGRGSESNGEKVVESVIS
jgi:hypothetical protein